LDVGVCLASPSHSSSCACGSLSSSEAATLTLHVYWTYKGKTTETHMRLKCDQDAEGHEALVCAVPGLEVSTLIQFRSR
jgi:hypothetical protein